MADQETCARDCYEVPPSGDESGESSEPCHARDTTPAVSEPQRRDDFSIATEAELHQRYPPQPVVRPPVGGVDLLGRGLIALSPFLMITTSGPGGLDCWPKGGAPGFVEVRDYQTLLVPDRSEDGHLVGLRNIILNPAVGLIFLVPGMNETFRVKGRAAVSTDPVLLNRFPDNEAPVRSVIVVHVEQSSIHSGEASMRAALWNPATHLPREGLPTLDEMLEAQRELTAGARSPQTE